MSTIDSRIVTMKFDNTSFQRGVESTLSLLGKLKTTVAGLPGSTKGLSGIGTALSNVNVGSLQTQVDGVTHSFSAMSAVAVTALATITNKVVNAGLEMGKSLTLQPLMDGFAEYELTMGSIQTILSNTSRYGTTLQDVTKNLDELNKYADKTIYNFGDMTKNIGLFTNAGIRIEDATSMIKGFSNEAAASGTNAQGAASAAYQLSQALSAGTIRLMDWRSLQNVGMGNKNMQNGLIELADTMGELDKAGTSSKEVQDNFNGSLEKNWLSADVMSNYLKIMAGDMTKAEMKTLGLTDAQVKMFTAQQKMSEDAATKVRTWTQLIGTIRESIGSGWSETFKIIFGDFNEATKLFTGLNNTIGGALGSISDSRNKLLKGWDKLGGRTALMQALVNVFTAFGHILGPIADAWRDVFPAATSKGLYELTVAFRDFTEGLIAGEGTMKNIHDIFFAVFSVLHLGLDVVFGIIHYFTSLIGLLAGGTGGILDFVGAIARVISALTEWINTGDYIEKFFDHVIAGRAALLGPIIDLLSDMLSVLAGFVDVGAAKVIEGLSAAFEAMAPYLPLIADGLEAAGDAVQGKLIAGFDALMPVLAGVGNAIQDAFSSLSGIGGSLGGAASGLAGMFDLGGSTDVAVSGINDVKDALAGTGGVASKAGNEISGFARFMQSVGKFLGAVAVGIGNAVSVAWGWAIDKLSNIGSNFGAVFGAISSFFGGIKDAIVGYFSNLGFDEGLALVNTGFFIAFYIMLRKFLGQFKDVFSSIAGTFDSASGVFDQLTNNLKTMQTDVKANIILKIAAALAILAISLYILSKIEPKKLGVALGAILTMLGMLVLAIKSLEKVTEGVDYKSSVKLVALSIVIMALAGAILLLSVALALLSQLSLAEIGKGLGTIAVVMGLIIGATKLLEKSGGAKDILVASVAIGILAFALTAFAGALMLYAALDTGALAEGGAKVAAALLVIGLTMSRMPKNMIASAAAVYIVASALVVLAGALKMMATMSGGDIVKALITMGGALLIISIALNSMEAALPGAAALIVAAAALVLLAVAMQMLGNLSLQEIGIALLALVGVFTVLGLAALIMAPIVPVLMGLAIAIGLLGIAALAVGAGLLLFSIGLATLAASGAAGAAVLVAAIVAIAEIFPLIAQQFGLGLIALAKVIADSGPALINAFATVLGSMIEAGIRVVPKVGRLISTLITTALRVLTQAIPQFVTAGVKIVTGILTGIGNNIGKLVTAATTLVVRFITAIGNNAPRVADAGAKMIIKFINGLADAIDNNVDDLRAAGLNLAHSIIDGMTGGLLDYGTAKVEGAVNALMDKIPGWAKKMLDINSPSKRMIPVGEGVGEGVAVGIDNTHGTVKDSADALSRVALDTISTTMSNIGDALSTNVDFDPTITPVLDLTKLTQDANSINGLFSGQSITPSVSYAQANDIASQQDAIAEAAALMAEAAGPTEIKFEQNNYSPKAISHVDNYRSTKSLLSLAEEALK